jgi:hypothetical protein
VCAQCTHPVRSIFEGRLVTAVTSRSVVVIVAASCSLRSARVLRLQESMLGGCLCLVSTPLGSVTQYTCTFGGRGGSVHAAEAACCSKLQYGVVLLGMMGPTLRALQHAATLAFGGHNAYPSGIL